MGTPPHIPAGPSREKTSVLRAEFFHLNMSPTAAHKRTFYCFWCNRMQHGNNIWQSSEQQADNWDYFHVCLSYLLSFYCCPALLTPSLRGVGVNKHSNDVWTFGHAATMAPLDRCTYPHLRSHAHTRPPRSFENHGNAKEERHSRVMPPDFVGQQTWGEGEQSEIDRQNFCHKSNICVME